MFDVHFGNSQIVLCRAINFLFSFFMASREYGTA